MSEARVVHGHERQFKARQVRARWSPPPGPRQWRSCCRHRRRGRDATTGHAPTALALCWHGRVEARYEIILRTPRIRIAVRREMPTPPRWGDDELTKFLDSVRKNQFATFVNNAETRRMIGIDESFWRVLDGWINPRDLTAALLMYRAHSAYRAAASCAFSGQSTELHPLLRLMLEQGGYAILINRKSELAEVWLNRHETDTDRAAVPREFTVGNIKSVLASSDPRLKNFFGELYERTIDFGATQTR